jgi:hypothetical protein
VSKDTAVAGRHKGVDPPAANRPRSRFASQIEEPADTTLPTAARRDIYLCMRTSIDIPDALMERAKRAAAKRKTTLRRLVLDALEQSLREKPQPFRLRDASAGDPADVVEAAAITRAIDEQRERDFQP